MPLHPDAARRPGELRVEHLYQPLGLGERSPRLSWRPPPGSAAQKSYRIRLTSGEVSGWVSSGDSVLVGWQFAPLGSRQRLTWQIRVVTDQAESEWSQPSAMEAGLEKDDWTASWISPAEATAQPSTKRPAYELRGTITLDKPVARARLYATAHGIYEAFLGGRRVGDLETLRPPTSPARRNWRAASPGSSAVLPTPPATPASRPASVPRGRPNSSTPTAASVPRPRQTSSAR